MKFGADVMAPMNNEYLDVAPTRGNLAFNGQFTGNGFADFMLGYAQRAQLTNVFVVEQQLRSYGFYVQDDWKATDTLTVNLGVRYDYMPPATEANNRMANFDPVAGALVFASDGSVEDRALVKPDRNNFSPRIGRDLQGRRSHASSAADIGIFYNQFDRIGSEDQLALNPPGLANIDVQSAGTSTVPILRLQDGFPANFLDPANINVARIMVRAADRNSPRTMVQQFGGGVERQIGRELCRLGRLCRLIDRAPRGAAQHQSAAAGHARRERPAAISGVRQRPVARDDRRGELQRHRPVVREAVQRWLQLPDVVHGRRGTRSGARAPQRLVRQPAERT